MELTYTQFEVLQLVVRRKGLSKSELCSGLPFTQEVISRTLKELTKNKLVNLRQAGIKPTQKAWDVLEPYRVKRAVILAAGMGTRMRPETQNTPKPMVRVGNKRIIETQLDALQKAGISDITIVRGYLGNAFDELLNDYPNLRFINNPQWDTMGAIVSTSLTLDILDGAYLIEGDLYVQDSDTIRPYELRSSYCGIPGEVEQDWYFDADKSNLVKKLAHGSNVNKHAKTHKFVGIMYWDLQHAKMLKNDLPKVLQDQKNHQRFIESVPFDEQTGDYKIYARQISEGSVIEIDTFLELQTLRQKLNN